MNFQVIDDKRKAKRYTVTELCDLAGIDRTSYYIYLKDPGKMRISIWEKLVKILEMTEAERRASLR